MNQINTGKPTPGQNDTCLKLHSHRVSDKKEAFGFSGNTALSPEQDTDNLQVVRCSNRQWAEAGFKKLDIRDRRWAAPILGAEDSLGSDGCFGTHFLWGDAYGLTAARSGDRMIAKYVTDDRMFFAYPSGSGPLRPAVSLMKQLARQKGQPLLIKGMTEEQRNRLEAEFPTQFVFEEMPGSADYIYEADSLAKLAGKKLHNKRNHCNRFEQECPDWHFESLGQQHFSSCLNLLDTWEEIHEGQEDGMPEAEKNAILKAFKHYDALGLEGGVLYAGGRLIAFTLGEPVGKNGFDVRFEKADISVHGAYQMINREFIRHLLAKHPHLRYVNREEDMGMENLCKAKESYYPAFMLKKYAGRWD